MNQKQRKEIRKKTRGQSLVEMTLVLPVLLILLAGLVDSGMAFFSYAAVREAAEEAASYGAIVPVKTDKTTKNTDAIEQRARTSSNNPVNLADTSKVFVTITMDSSPCPGDSIKVEVLYEYTPIMPLFQTLWASKINLRAEKTNIILKSNYTC